MNNPFENALTQLAHAEKLLLSHTKNASEKKLLEQKLNALKKPNNSIDAPLEVVMDDGTRKIFQGYRVQYNNALGPYKGGIRYHPQVSLDEVKALSFWMTIKCAVAGLSYGGGKGGIVVDPKQLSQNELEQLTRAYGRALWNKVGAHIDVPAPDVNTNGQIMEWFLDEIRNQHQMHNTTVPENELLATVTGKPLGKGGSEGREEATGKGGLFVLLAALKKLGIDPKKKQLTAAVQGFGNVGFYIAKFLDEVGIKVVATSDSKGAIYVPEGINPDLTMECKKQNGYLAGCYCVGTVCDLKKGKMLPSEALLELPVDILVPAALENQLTASNASKIKAKVILEMANGPTTPEADEILHKRGITVIPDVLANSGGVTVSYFEWLQNLENKHWTKEEVFSKLKAKMNEAVEDVWKARGEYETDLRNAAFLAALERILAK